MSIGLRISTKYKNHETFVSIALHEKVLLIIDAETELKRGSLKYALFSYWSNQIKKLRKDNRF